MVAMPAAPARIRRREAPVAGFVLMSDMLFFMACVVGGERGMRRRPRTVRRIARHILNKMPAFFTWPHALDARRGCI